MGDQGLKSEFSLLGSLTLSALPAQRSQSKQCELIRCAAGVPVCLDHDLFSKAELISGGI
jgi:hypothetical protein